MVMLEPISETHAKIAFSVPYEVFGGETSGADCHF
jgi:hypothetical protein